MQKKKSLLHFEPHFALYGLEHIRKRERNALGCGGKFQFCVSFAKCSFYTTVITSTQRYHVKSTITQMSERCIVKRETGNEIIFMMMMIPNPVYGTCYTKRYNTRQAVQGTWKSKQMKTH